jgi:hypothetical protein
MLIGGHPSKFVNKLREIPIRTVILTVILKVYIHKDGNQSVL